MHFEHSTKHSVNIVTNFKTKIHRSPWTLVQKWVQKISIHLTNDVKIHILLKKQNKVKTKPRNMGISSRLDPSLGRGSSPHSNTECRPKLLRGQLASLSQGKCERWCPKIQMCLMNITPEETISQWLLKLKFTPGLKDPTHHNSRDWESPTAPHQL